MLKRVKKEDAVIHSVKIKDASFPAPFKSGLEYAAPARGTWNIVHVGMLIPKAHQIFVCAQGCLRGTVLTAAEMGVSDRFSTVTIREQNVLDGDMEALIIDGVSDIIEKLPKRPPAILVYTSCVHHFMGSDLTYVYKTLREKYPDIRFTDCYMNPIMRKSGLTPDQIMRKQLYSLLLPMEKKKKAVAIIGNEFSTHDSSELMSVLVENGFDVREITRCKTFEEYLALAECSYCISTQPAAIAAGKELEEKLGMKHIHMPFSFDTEEIRKNLDRLCDFVEIPKQNWSEKAENAEAALQKAYKKIGKTPITIDYTAFTRPLSLARMLLERGFNVTGIFLDGITGEEKGDFEFLRENYPELTFYPTVHTCMRVFAAENNDKTLAIGQKAAYFTATPYFVNVVSNDGSHSFDAIVRLAALMEEAFDTAKDTRSLIQIKGQGCGCCG